MHETKVENTTHEDTLQSQNIIGNSTFLKPLYEDAK